MTGLLIGAAAVGIVIGAIGVCRLIYLAARDRS